MIYLFLFIKPPICDLSRVQWVLFGRSSVCRLSAALLLVLNLMPAFGLSLKSSKSSSKSQIKVLPVGFCTSCFSLQDRLVPLWISQNESCSIYSVLHVVHPSANHWVSVFASNVCLFLHQCSLHRSWRRLTAAWLLCVLSCFLKRGRRLATAAHGGRRSACCWTCWRFWLHRVWFVELGSAWEARGYLQSSLQRSCWPSAAALTTLWKSESCFCSREFCFRSWERTGPWRERLCPYGSTEICVLTAVCWLSASYRQWLPTGCRACRWNGPCSSEGEKRKAWNRTAPCWGQSVYFFSSL